MTSKWHAQHSCLSTYCVGFIDTRILALTCPFPNWWSPDLVHQRWLGLLALLSIIWLHYPLRLLLHFFFLPKNYHLTSVDLHSSFIHHLLMVACWRSFDRRLRVKPGFAMNGRIDCRLNIREIKLLAVQMIWAYPTRRDCIISMRHRAGRWKPESPIFQIAVHSYRPADRYVVFRYCRTYTVKLADVLTFFMFFADTAIGQACRVWGLLQRPPLEKGGVLDLFFLLIYSFKFMSAFQPRFAVTAIAQPLLNKSSAVAEMGDSLATIDMGWKVGGCCGGRGAVPLSLGDLGPHLTQCGLYRGLFHTE